MRETILELVKKLEALRTEAVKDAVLEKPATGSALRLETELARLARRSPVMAGAWTRREAKNLSLALHRPFAPFDEPRAWPPEIASRDLAGTTPPLRIQESEFAEWASVTAPPLGEAGACWRAFAGAYIPYAEGVHSGTGPDDYCRVAVLPPWDLARSAGEIRWAWGAFGLASGWALVQRTADATSWLHVSKHAPWEAEIEDARAFLLEAFRTGGESVLRLA